jgi:plastocyanin
MHRRFSSLKLVLFVIPAFAIVACTGDEGPSPVTPTQAPDPAGEDGHVVGMSNLQFETDRLEILVGESVSWSNDDGVIHTVTHGSQGQPIPDGLFDQSIQPGERFTVPFDVAGTYPVTCTIHPAMNMEVVVTEGGENGEQEGESPEG